MTTHDKGDISVLKIRTRLRELGHIVLIPDGENHRFDLVFENDKRTFKKVQCKTGKYHKDKGVIIFPTASTSWDNGQQKKSKRVFYDKKDVDYFAVYCFELKTIYLIPFKKATTKGGSMYLRVDKTKNGQNKKINWAKSFEI